MNELEEDTLQDSFQEFASQALRLTRKGSFEQLLAQHLIHSVSMARAFTGYDVDRAKRKQVDVEYYTRCSDFPEMNFINVHSQ